MTEGSAPSTRLSATERLLGWTNWTVLLRPMLNDSQLIATFWLDWRMVMSAPCWAIVAAPLETVPPFGKVWACGGAGQRSEGEGGRSEQDGAEAGGGGLGAGDHDYTPFFQSIGRSAARAPLRIA